VGVATGDEDHEAGIAREQGRHRILLLEEPARGVRDLPVRQPGRVDDAEALRLPADHAAVHQRDRIPRPRALLEVAPYAQVRVTIPLRVDDEPVAAVARPYRARDPARRHGEPERDGDRAPGPAPAP